MPEEKEVIVLDQNQLFELEEIIMERDKESALKFLEKHIYKPIKKKQGNHCKPPF